MRFQINQGWAIGQFLIPASTVIDLVGKAENELTEFERLARGRVPPIDAICVCARDALATALTKLRLLPQASRFVSG